eukprot:g12228.t1
MGLRTLLSGGGLLCMAADGVLCRGVTKGDGMALVMPALANMSEDLIDVSTFNLVPMCTLDFFDPDDAISYYTNTYADVPPVADFAMTTLAAFSKFTAFKSSVMKLTALTLAFGSLPMASAWNNRFVTSAAIASAYWVPGAHGAPKKPPDDKPSLEQDLLGQTSRMSAEELRFRQRAHTLAQLPLEFMATLLSSWGQLRRSDIEPLITDRRQFIYIMRMLRINAERTDQGHRSLRTLGQWARYERATDQIRTAIEHCPDADTLEAMRLQSEQQDAQAKAAAKAAANQFYGGMPALGAPSPMMPLHSGTAANAPAHMVPPEMFMPGSGGGSSSSSSGGNAFGSGFQSQAGFAQCAQQQHPFPVPPRPPSPFTNLGLGGLQQQQQQTYGLRNPMQIHHDPRGAYHSHRGPGAKPPPPPVPDHPMPHDAQEPELDVSAAAVDLDPNAVDPHAGGASPERPEHEPVAPPGETCDDVDAEPKAEPKPTAKSKSKAKAKPAACSPKTKPRAKPTPDSPTPKRGPPMKKAKK